MAVGLDSGVGEGVALGEAVGVGFGVAEGVGLGLGVGVVFGAPEALKPAARKRQRERTMKREAITGFLLGVVFTVNPRRRRRLWQFGGRYYKSRRARQDYFFRFVSFLLAAQMGAHLTTVLCD